MQRHSVDWRRQDKGVKVNWVDFDVEEGTS